MDLDNAETLGTVHVPQPLASLAHIASVASHTLAPILVARCHCDRSRGISQDAL